MPENYYWVVWVLTISGWIALPFFNHFLTVKRDKCSECNKNIDKIEVLFETMNEEALNYYASKEFDSSSYYNLISINHRISFLCNNIAKLNKNFVIPQEEIVKIRQLTTNEQKKPEAIRELLAYQTSLLQSFPKTF